MKRDFTFGHVGRIEPPRVSPPTTSRLPVTARKMECKRIAEVDEICISVMGVQGMMAPSAFA